MAQSEYSQGYNNGHSDGVKFEREQQKARGTVPAIPEAKNITAAYLTDDGRVEVFFDSHSAASTFEKAINACKGKS